MLDKSKKFSTISLGCKVNRAEIDEYSAFLIANSWILSDIVDSEIILINTCTVTSIADKKTRQNIRRACSKNINENTKIIVTGCASEINNEAFKKIDSRIIIIPKRSMMEYLRNLCGGTTDDSYKKQAEILTSENFHTRASIKIQDGCDNSCTYCIVHTARGKSYSFDALDIENKFKSLIEAGIKEVVLTGVNLGVYQSSGLDLTGLCKNLINIIDNFYCSSKEVVPARIRLSSIELPNINMSLINLIKNSNGKICRQLHLPLQSGSESVLKEMHRNYSAKEYLEKIEILKSNIPEISLSTDIIVGFPGETEENFQETINLAQKCKFMKIHVFPYSKREGTPAAIRADQIPDSIKTKRAKILRELSSAMQKEDFEKRQGNTEYVLYETNDIVRTESYHRYQTCNHLKAGSLVEVVL